MGVDFFLFFQYFTLAFPSSEILMFDLDPVETMGKACCLFLKVI